MRVLLDECLPRRLKQVLSQHTVSTVPEVGWAGMENGELLRLAAGEFDAFVTIDQNRRYQQSLEEASIAVVVLDRSTAELHAAQLAASALRRSSAVEQDIPAVDA